MLSRHKSHSFVISGIELELFRKDVKHLNLRIYPPSGVVRVTAPERMSMSSIVCFVEKKLPWIKKHKERISLLPEPMQMSYLEGEKHLFLGKMYAIEYRKAGGGSKAVFQSNRTLQIEVREGKDSSSVAGLIRTTYRRELQSILDNLVPKWENCLGVRSKRIRIRLMKRKWGACRPFSGDIVFNLDLMKYPAIAIEYVVLHELAHLIEPSHNLRFQQILSKHMPNWREVEGILNQRIPTEVFP